MEIKFDVNKIQERIDAGFSSREIIKEMGMSTATLDRYSKVGLVKFKSRSEAAKLHYQKYPERHIHTQESKDKISKARKKFLLENPDQNPYILNHKSKGASYPELYFRECLKLSSYTQEYRVGLYSLDFADVNFKIDLEIDGHQHVSDPRIVEHDIKRNNNLIKLGWKIIRLNWSEFKKLKDLEKFSIINSIKERKIINSSCLTYFGF